MGIVLLMVYWRHQSQQRSLRNRRHASESSRIPAADGSPDLDDPHVIENRINDEILMLQHGHLSNTF